MIRANLLNESAVPGLAYMYPIGYTCIMNTIIRTDERGNFGDCRPVGAGVLEMRVHSGPGYRVYFTQVGDVVYVFLCGGTKRGQDRDITRAKSMARLLRGK